MDDGLVRGTVLFRFNRCSQKNASCNLSRDESLIARLSIAGASGHASALVDTLSGDLGYGAKRRSLECPLLRFDCGPLKGSYGVGSRTAALASGFLRSQSLVTKLFLASQQLGVLPLRPQMILHAFIGNLTIELVDHIGAGAGIAGQREHINAMGKLLADVIVPERI